MIDKIVSGGQTGADRAALDFAIRHNMPHGGWVPKGRRAEDGPLPRHYLLDEMPTTGYPERTKRNVIESDGTVIISYGRLIGGSGLTRKYAIEHGRPWLHLDMAHLSEEDAATTLKAWLGEHDVRVLNVAGPRASDNPHIYDVTLRVLELTLENTIRNG